MSLHGQNVQIHTQIQVFRIEVVKSLIQTHPPSEQWIHCKDCEILKVKDKAGSHVMFPYSRRFAALYIHIVPLKK